MRHDHARGIRQDRHLEHVPRVNKAAIERAPAQFMNAEEPMLRVHEQHEADFNGLLLKAWL